MVDSELIKNFIIKLGEDQAFFDAVNNIKVGDFPRDPADPNYQSRLVYTRELRKFVYNPGVLNVILSNAELKEAFFRTFGYRGQLDFTVYPHVWMRDLPLLDFGEKTYLGDDIILGTNMVSIDQKTISVGRISIGSGTIFNQKCALSLHTRIGSQCVFGFRSSLGLYIDIGNNVRIGEETKLGHGTRVGSDVRIGQGCLLGNSCIVEDQVVIQNHTRIPASSRVTQNGIEQIERK